MAPPNVLLARPGELIRAQAAVSLWATRAGGLPTYPAGCSSLETDPPTCQACGKPLALLLQAHAPLSADQLEGGEAQPWRFLFVFGCAAEGCGKQPGCFQALRLVATPSSSTAGAGGDSSSAAADVQQPAQAKQQQQQQPAAPATADDWGVGGGDDWGVSGSGADDWGASADASGAEAGDQGAAATGAAAFDFGDLNAALEAMGSTKAASKAGRSGAQGGGAVPAGPSEGEQAQPVYNADRPCLPAFYLYAEAEAEADKRGASSGSGGSEQDHLAALLARYEEEAAAASDAAEAAPALPPAAIAAGACLPGGSGSGGSGSGSGSAGGGETWGGEGYEEDAVLAPGGGKKAAVGAAYLRFGRQVARCPDQCARCSFGGAPLWPTATPPPPPPPCPRCGAPRSFELQLMAPLIHGLSESAEWLAAEGGAARPPRMQLPPDSWEWLTVAVYTCSRSCCGGGGAASAEAVAVASEEA